MSVMNIHEVSHASSVFEPPRHSFLLSTATTSSRVVVSIQPGERGKALLMIAWSLLGPPLDPLAVVSHRGPSRRRQLLLIIGARIYSGAPEVPLAIDGMVMKSKGGHIHCLALLSPFIRLSHKSRHSSPLRRSADNNSLEASALRTLI